MNILRSLFFLLLLYPCVSEAQQFDWAKSLPYVTGNDYTQYQSIAKDDQGNLIVSGFYIGSLVFGSTILTDVNCFYLAKYNTHGDVLWARSFRHGFTPANAIGPARITNITLDKNGNLFVCGFNNWLNAPEFFVKKFSPDGELIWSRTGFGKRNGSVAGLSSANTDETGNIYISGNFGDSLRIGSFSLGLPVGVTGSSSFFICKINPAGEPVWLKSNKLVFSGNQRYDASISGGAIDSKGNIILSGNYSKYLEIDNDSIGSLAGNIGTSYFVLKHDSSGNVNWIKGDYQRNLGIADIKVFSNDSIMVVLRVNGDAFYEGNPICSNGDSSVIALMKIDSIGSLGPVRLVKSMGQEGYTETPKIAFDNGKFFLCGVSKNIRVDNEIMNYGNDRGVYVAYFNEKGVLQWFTSWKQIAPPIIGNLQTSDKGDLILNGEFYYKLILGRDTLGPDVGSNHGFIAKLVKPIRMVEGVVFDDLNGNGIREGGEVLIKGVMIRSTTQGLYKFTDSSGEYRLPIDSNSTKIQVVLPRYWIQTFPIDTSGYLIPVSANDTVYENKSFGIHKLEVSDLRITVSNYTNRTRPGSNFNNKITYENLGTVTKSGVVSIKMDTNVEFLQSSPMPDSSNGNNVYWNYSNLSSGDKSSINLLMKVKTTTPIGTELMTIGQVEPLTGDSTSFDNTDTARQLVTGAIDPNEKKTTKTNMTLKEVQDGTFVRYTINFQNTGSDTAFYVVVRDSLSNLFNINTLEMLDASHPYILRIPEPSKLEWTFPNIQLVDSLTNEPLSHGFVTFQIKINKNVSPGSIVPNKAAIVFDYNSPVITNVATTAILGIVPINLLEFEAKKQGRVALVLFRISSDSRKSSVEIERSKDGRQFQSIKMIVLDNSSAPFGEYSHLDKEVHNGWNYYRLSMKDADGSVKYSKVKALYFGDELTINVSPNPFVSSIVLSGYIENKGLLITRVVDVKGISVYYDKKTYDRGIFTETINLPNIASGIYMLKITVDGKERIFKIVKK